MEPIWVILIIVLYFGVLIAIGAYTGRNANNEAFFLGNRRSPWYIVAFGMLEPRFRG